MHSTVKLTLFSGLCLCLVVLLRNGLQDNIELAENGKAISGPARNAPLDFDYIQYEKARAFLNKDSTLHVNLMSHKMNVNSSYRPEDHVFRVGVDRVKDSGIFLHVMVAEKSSGAPVPGCSFESIQRFVVTSGSASSSLSWEQRRIAMCETLGYQRGTYTVFCMNHGSRCATIDIRFRFSRYEQYRDEPKVFPWNHVIHNQEHCHSFAAPSKLAEKKSVSWSVDAHEQCENLYVNNLPVSLLSEKETCDCVRRYDDVYLIGTSHIRFFSDFLLGKCCGQNFTGIAHNHKDLELGNVHYLAWTFIEQFHFLAQVNLPRWIDPSFPNWNATTPKPGTVPGRKIAIWIQTGSWDFSKISYNFSMEHAIPILEDTLRYIQTQIKKSSAMTKVDLRVISTTPMHDKWYWNNNAIRAFNAKERDMVRRLGIDYTDILAMELPCKDQLAANHYFFRDNETFGGTVGENVYFGAFLPKICL